MRHMRKNAIVFAAAVVLVAVSSTGLLAQTVNKLTDAEKKQGWVLLFNGQNFDGWRQCNGTAMPANWVVEDQAMKVFTAEGQEAGAGFGRRCPLQPEEVCQLRVVDRLEDRKGRQLRDLLQREGGAWQADLLRGTRSAGARQRRCHRQQDCQPSRGIACTT